MTWEKYFTNFTVAAISQGFDEAYIVRCLEYGNILFNKNLPIIYSLEHLANLVGFQDQYIRGVAYSQRGYYRNFFIKKKSGRLREISEPLPNLKLIQRWITDNLLYKIEVSAFAKAFIKDRSIKDNARFHRGQKIVLTVDIKDFFSSITSNSVRNFFLSCGYSKKVSYFLTRLTTLDGSLPQGTPSSPYLSNIIFLPLDEEISQFCLEKNIRYTRYADDLTFSGDFSPAEVISFARRILGKLHLNINNEKTRIMRPHHRQMVTGIVVNEKIQAPRDMRRKLRQDIFYIKKFGFDYHVAKIRERRSNYRFHLMGLANFLLFLNPKDRDAIIALEVLRNYEISKQEF